MAAGLDRDKALDNAL
ncbi:hypothetical protein, partial [Frankia sp. ACN1ag]